MPAYVGLLTLKTRTPKAQVDLAKEARTLGCMSVWCTEADPDVIATFNANDEATAMKSLEAVAKKHGATAVLRRALSEGEKEREVVGKLYV